MKRKYNKKQRKIIIQLNRKGEELARYISVKDASEKTGVATSGIYGCINGRLPEAGKCKWQQIVLPKEPKKPVVPRKKEPELTEERKKEILAEMEIRFQRLLLMKDELIRQSEQMDEDED